MENSKKAWLAGGAALLLAVAAITWDATRERGNQERKAFAARDREMARLDAEQKDLAAQIKKFVGDGACEQDRDCQVLGLGAKTCEKYLNFLVYSVKDARLEDLNSAVQRFNSNQQRINDLSLTVPHCGVDMPEARCEKDRCVAGP